MTVITGVMPDPLWHIVLNLRPADQAEMEAVHGIGFNPETLVDTVCRVAQRGMGWLFWSNGPVACLGAYPMTPTCASVWAFGTPGWRRVVLGMTRHVKRTMIPTLLKIGCHRAECRALTARQDTYKWLVALGAVPEAVLSEFGTRREDFTLFAWHADEQTHHLRRVAERGGVPLRNGG